MHIQSKFQEAMVNFSGGNMKHRRMKPFDFLQSLKNMLHLRVYGNLFPFDVAVASVS